MPSSLNQQLESPLTQLTSTLQMSKVNNGRHDARRKNRGKETEIIPTFTQTRMADSSTLLQPQLIAIRKFSSNEISILYENETWQ